MTRCTEFYEKLEKDGNFCGMPRRSFEDAGRYWREYRKEMEKSGENSPLSEDAWIHQQRELNAQDEKEKTEKLYNKKTLNAADFAKGCVDFWIWARRYREEEVIEEVLDKARVSTR